MLIELINRIKQVNYNVEARGGSSESENQEKKDEVKEEKISIDEALKNVDEAIQKDIEIPAPAEAPEASPEVTVTEAEAPEASPEVTATEAEAPESSPEVTATEAEAPESSPEVTATEAEAPESSPEVTVTEAAAPESSPEVTATEAAASESSPEVTATETEAPESSPEVTATEAEAPEAPVPPESPEMEDNNTPGNNIQRILAGLESGILESNLNRMNKKMFFENLKWFAKCLKPGMAIGLGAAFFLGGGGPAALWLIPGFTALAGTSGFAASAAYNPEILELKIEQAELMYNNFQEIIKKANQKDINAIIRIKNLSSIK